MSLQNLFVKLKTEKAIPLSFHFLMVAILVFILETNFILTKKQYSITKGMIQPFNWLEDFHILIFSSLDLHSACILKKRFQHEK